MNGRKSRSWPDPFCIIIGVGHLQCGDDAAGILAAAELRRRSLPAAIEVTDVGSDGFALIQHLERAPWAVIMDAVAMAEPPGTIRIFSRDEIGPVLQRKPISIHSFDLVQMLDMAAHLGIRPEIRLIGIEPHIMKVGAPLSRPIRDGIAKLADAALNCALTMVTPAPLKVL